MSKEIVAKVDKEELSSEHITFTPYGVEFTEDERPTVEELHKAILKVQNVHGMLQFYVGDLMIFAESQVTGWGERTYEKLIDATGYDYNTLGNFKMVARAFPPTFRESIFRDVAKNAEVVTVSWGHFRELVPTMRRSPEHAKYFLEMVRDGRWTISKLREEIIRYKNNGQLPDVVEKQEPTRAEKSFIDFRNKFYRGYSPSLSGNEVYDEKTWLVEMIDVMKIRLEELGVQDG